MDIQNFINIQSLGGFATCVAVVVLLTHFSKELVDLHFKKVPTKYVCFLFALFVVFSYQFMSNTFDAKEIPLTVINAVLVSMVASATADWTGLLKK
jgi:FtsH-binding integral membrane protein